VDSSFETGMALPPVDMVDPPGAKTYMSGLSQAFDQALGQQPTALPADTPPTASQSLGTPSALSVDPSLGETLLPPGAVADATTLVAQYSAVATARPVEAAAAKPATTAVFVPSAVERSAESAATPDAGTDPAAPPVMPVSQSESFGAGAASSSLSGASEPAPEAPQPSSSMGDTPTQIAAATPSPASPRQSPGAVPATPAAQQQVAMSATQEGGTTATFSDANMSGPAPSPLPPSGGNASLQAPSPTSAPLPLLSPGAVPATSAVQQSVAIGATQEDGTTAAFYDANMSDPDPSPLISSVGNAPLQAPSPTSAPLLPLLSPGAVPATSAVQQSVAIGATEEDGTTAAFSDANMSDPGPSPLIPSVGNAPPQAATPAPTLPPSDLPMTAAGQAEDAVDVTSENPLLSAAGLRDTGLPQLLPSGGAESLGADSMSLAGRLQNTAGTTRPDQPIAADALLPPQSVPLTTGLSLSAAVAVGAALGASTASIQLADSDDLFLRPSVPDLQSIAPTPLPARDSEPLAPSPPAAAVIPVPETMLREAADPWAVLVAAYAAIAPPPLQGQLIFALAGGDGRADRAGPPSSETAPTTTPEALLPYFVMGQIAESALPLLEHPLYARYDGLFAREQSANERQALFRESLDEHSARLIDGFAPGSVLDALLRRGQVSEELRERLRGGDIGAGRHLLNDVARFETLLEQSPFLAVGTILRRGITDDAGVIRSAAALPVGVIFQERGLVVGTRFPEFGIHRDGFLSRALSCEIIVARAVRGLTLGHRETALAPQTRFVLAARMGKPASGLHLIVFAFGREDEPDGDDS
jgi:hypothetical protein